MSYQGRTACAVERLRGAKGMTFLTGVVLLPEISPQRSVQIPSRRRFRPHTASSNRKRLHGKHRRAHGCHQKAFPRSDIWNWEKQAQIRKISTKKKRTVRLPVHRPPTAPQPPEEKKRQKVTKSAREHPPSDGEYSEEDDTDHGPSLHEMYMSRNARAIFFEAMQEMPSNKHFTPSYPVKKPHRPFVPTISKLGLDCQTATEHCRPPSPRHNYIKATEERGLAPLPVLDFSKESFVRVSLAKHSRIASSEAFVADGILDKAFQNMHNLVFGDNSNSGKLEDGLADSLADSYAESFGNSPVRKTFAGMVAKTRQVRSASKKIRLQQAKETMVNSRRLMISALPKTNPEVEGQGQRNLLHAVASGIAHYDEATDTLSYANYYLGDKRGRALADALRHFPFVIRNLDLSNVGLGDSAVIAVMKSVQQLGYQGQAEAGTNIRLENLILSKNKFAYAGCCKISQFLLDSHASDILYIHDLDLSGNKIGDHAIKDLVKAIIKISDSSTSCPLTRLDLSDSTIKESAVDLAKLLDLGNPPLPRSQLETLVLKWNHISGDAGHIFATALSHNCTLTCLDVSFNAFGSPGIPGVLESTPALALAEALRTNTTLRSINLTRNRVGDRLSMVLAKYLHENSTLRHLALSGNVPGKAGGLALIKVMARPVQGCSILMKDCTFDAKEATFGLANSVDVEDPTGSYKNLDLSRPYDRLVACHLFALTIAGMGAIVEGSCTLQKYPAFEYTKGASEPSPSGSNGAAGTASAFCPTFPGLAQGVGHAESGRLLAQYRSNKGIGVSNHGLLDAQLLELLERPLEDIEQEMDHQLPLEGRISLGFASQQTGSGVGGGVDGKAKLCDKSFENLWKGLLCSFPDDTKTLSMLVANLASGFIFTLPQVKMMLGLVGAIDASADRVHMLTALLPQMEDRHAEEEIVRGHRYKLPSEAQVQARGGVFFTDLDGDGWVDAAGDICALLGLEHLPDMEQRMIGAALGPWTHFNRHNLTGHYRLNLGNKMERVMALDIFAINTADMQMRKHLGLADMSQTGNWMCFRNEKYQEKTTVITKDWEMPKTGTLEFDIALTERPDGTVSPLHEQAFDVFLAEFEALTPAALRIARSYDGHINEQDQAMYVTAKLRSLRRISSNFYLSCDQVVRILNSWTRDEIAKRNLRRKTEMGMLRNFESFEEGISKVGSSMKGWLQQRREGGEKSEDHMVSQAYKAAAAMSAAREWLVSMKQNKGARSKNCDTLTDITTTALVRACTFVVLFARIVDEEHLHLCLACLKSKQEIEYTRLCLGHLNMFNPLKPGAGGGRYELNLEVHEERLVFKILMKIVQAEKTTQMIDIFFKGNGTELPPLWYTDNFKELPARGLIQLTLVTTDEFDVYPYLGTAVVGSRQIVCAKASKNSKRVRRGGPQTRGGTEFIKAKAVDLSEEAIEAAKQKLVYRKELARTELGWRFNGDGNVEL